MIIIESSLIYIWEGLIYHGLWLKSKITLMKGHYTEPFDSRLWK